MASESKASIYAVYMHRSKLAEILVNLFNRELKSSTHYLGCF